jgi:hypothetical protein
MSGEIIQDESSNVTGVPTVFDSSLSSWVDLKNSFCEVDEELDQLTLIWDQEDDCFHCQFLHELVEMFRRSALRRLNTWKASDLLWSIDDPLTDTRQL